MKRVPVVDEDDLDLIEGLRAGQLLGLDPCHFEDHSLLAVFEVLAFTR